MGAGPGVSDGTPAATTEGIAGFPACADVPQIRADESLYRDEPVYGNADELVQDVHEWAAAQPGFVELGLDRERNGWVTVWVKDADVEAMAAAMLAADERRDELQKAGLERAAQFTWDETARRLATIPGVGPITASLIAATVTDIGLFKSARHFAAWLGLVPKQNSTGGKTRLGRITKVGNGARFAAARSSRCQPARSTAR